MNTYQTPGVYIAELNNLPMSKSPQLATVPAFIGKTLKVPENDQNEKGINPPIKIESMEQYTRLFGKAGDQEFTFEYDTEKKTIKGAHKNLAPNLYHHMQLYFSNGGGSCYVSSVEDNKYTDTLDALKKRDDITLIVLADAATGNKEEYFKLVQKALNQCMEQNQFLLVDIEYEDDLTQTRQKLGSDNLQYGAAYTPYLNTSLNYYQYNDDEIVIKKVSSTETKAGIEKYILSKIEVKGEKKLDDKISGKQKYNPKTPNNSDNSDNPNNPNNIDDHLFHLIKSEAQKITIDNMPPSAAVAGIYARVERDRGVWQSPANVVPHSVLSPVSEITAEQQHSLNIEAKTGKSINAIRQFIDRGLLVWGARTLKGNDNNWRYIAVRRTVSYVERTVKNELQPFVFEANTPMTWLKINTMIAEFLEDLWQQGGLTGATAKDAFFIEIGQGTTMTDQDILEGRMKIRIGLAAVRPAEFIIVEFSQLMQKA